MKTICIWGLAITLALSFTSLPLFGQSQKQWNNWHFGNGASIRFDGANPISLSGSSMNAKHIAISMSDENGLLQFYGDGQTVWNRNHLVMPNGTGLAANPNSYNSYSFAVPKPGSTDGYYIFCSDNSSPLVYSEVDMSLDGGFGNIPAGKKNVNLSGGYLGGKATAIRHGNGINFWIVINTVSGSLIAYEFGPSGYLGSVASPGYGIVGSFGAMKASPDGSKLALSPKDGFDGYEDFLILVLMDFDANTGLVSSPELYYDNAHNFTYSLAFSPDGEKLYRSRLPMGQVIQYDLTAGSATAVMASATGIGPVGNYGELQLGPDGKIYVSKDGSDYLDVISRPDSLGMAAFFQSDWTYLGGYTSNLGLPVHPVNLYFSSCQYAEAPSGLYTVDNGLTVEFNWSAVPNSVGCQLRGRPFSSSVFAYRNIATPEATQLEIPWSILNSGYSYLYQVRCACSLTPPDLTDWSFVDVFTVPSPREGAVSSAQTMVYPNPAASVLQVDFEKFKLSAGTDFNDGEVQLRLMGLDGKTYLAQLVSQNNLELDVSSLSDGQYLLEVVVGGVTERQMVQIQK